jgi:hypothetical protein
MFVAVGEDIQARASKGVLILWQRRRGEAVSKPDQS